MFLGSPICGVNKLSGSNVSRLCFAEPCFLEVFFVKTGHLYFVIDEFYQKFDQQRTSTPSIEIVLHIAQNFPLSERKGSFFAKVSMKYL